MSYCNLNHLKLIRRVRNCSLLSIRRQARQLYSCPSESLQLISAETGEVDREQMAKIARENVEYFSELYEKAYRKYMQTRMKVA